MLQGKFQSAFHLLEEGSDTKVVLREDDVLPSGETVSDVLRSKHTVPQGLKEEALCSSQNVPPLPDQVIHDCFDGDFIRYATNKRKVLQAHLDLTPMHGHVCAAHSRKCLMTCATF